MNEPTEQDIRKPVVHNRSGCVWEIRRRRRDGVVGIWTLYRGFRDRVNWANFELLERLPLDDVEPAGAGGLP
jgi:hypothetical protein